MAVVLQLDFEQVKALVQQCDPEQKLELVRQLKDETFSSRLSRLRSKLSTVDLSMDEISEEVSKVRENLR